MVAIRSAALAVGVLVVSGAAHGQETFRFGGNQNQLLGQASALLVSNGVGLSLQAGVPGSVMNEFSQSGLGIDSRGVPGAIESGPTGSTIDFNLLGPSAGDIAESLVFSFDTAGVLTEINFDGVKDESREFFRLQSPSGVAVYFFDSAVPGSVTAGLSGTVVLLQEEIGNREIDDLSPPLSIPFSAGEPLTLSFGALPGGTEVANGSRLQSLTVVPVPEPGAIALLLVASVSRVARR